MLAKDNSEVIRLNGECSQIENLVVERAQGKPVLFDVRPASLKPFDVRGFETDGLLPRRRS